MKRYIPTYENYIAESIENYKELSKDESDLLSDTLSHQEQEQEAIINKIKDDAYYIVMNYMANINSDIDEDYDLNSIITYMEDFLSKDEVFELDPETPLHREILRTTISKYKNTSLEDLEIFKDRDIFK